MPSKTTHGSGAPHAHPAEDRTAVLWCNLGSPDEPTVPAVRRYLSQFLHDHRVVEIPRAVWCLILHGIILRVRPAKSAAKYRSIWLPEGSPLKVWTEKQAKLLAGRTRRMMPCRIRHQTARGISTTRWSWRNCDR